MFHLKRLILVSRGEEIGNLGYSIEDIFMYWDIPGGKDYYKLSLGPVFDKSKDSSMFVMSEFSDSDYQKIILDAWNAALGKKNEAVTVYVRDLMRKAPSSKIFFSALQNLISIIKNSDIKPKRFEIRVPDSVKKTVKDLKPRNILCVDYYPETAKQIKSYLSGSANVSRVPLGADKDKKFDLDINTGRKFDLVLMHVSGLIGRLLSGREIKSMSMGVTIGGLSNINRAVNYLAPGGKLVITGYPGPLRSKRYLTLRLLNESRLLYPDNSGLTLVDESTYTGISNRIDSLDFSITRIEPPENKITGMYTFVALRKNDPKISSETPAKVSSDVRGKIQLTGGAQKSRLKFTGTSFTPSAPSKPSPSTPKTAAGKSPSPRATPEQASVLILDQIPTKRKSEISKIRTRAPRKNKDTQVLSKLVNKVAKNAGERVFAMNVLFRDKDLANYIVNMSKKENVDEILKKLIQNSYATKGPV